MAFLWLLEIIQRAKQEQSILKKEEREIENLAEQEKQKIRDIYAQKGFKDELLETIVNVITARRKVWVDTMMREEMSLMEDKNKRPLDIAITILWDLTQSV